MTIITKEKVQEAFTRAQTLGVSAQEAIKSIAQALALPVETVEEAVREVMA